MGCYKKFLSRRNSYKGSRKEDQKGCFNCKKPGNFIADCPDLQKEKSKDKSKKSTFKSNKIKKKIKQSLMATVTPHFPKLRNNKNIIRVIPQTGMSHCFSKLLNRI